MFRLKRMWTILKHTGTAAMLVNFLWIYTVAALIIWAVEPGIPGYGDALWYLYVAAMTIGFGDYAAVTLVGRIVTVCISIMAVILTAMITGVVVSYYTEYLKAKESETVSAFLEELEHLPELSPEELAHLSQRVSRFEEEHFEHRRFGDEGPKAR